MAERVDFTHRIANELRSKKDETRFKALDELRDVTTGSHELTPDINRHIYDLMQGNDPSKKLEAIMVIDKLINDNDMEEDTAKITRFANYLGGALQFGDVEVMKLSAQTLGRLANTTTGTWATVFVEFEVKRGLEWLTGERNELRRHAAVLIIRELAINVPTLVYPYVSEILDLIWVALRDSKVDIRVAAADALSQVLEIIYKRETTKRQEWYMKIKEEALKGSKVNPVECIHGSLLTYREMLLHAGMFMNDYYTECCDSVLRIKDHRDALVRRTVISIIPTLAQYNPAEFVNKYLKRCMTYLLSQLSKDQDKSAVFKSIGNMAIEVKNSIDPYLEEILTAIRENLSVKARSRTKDNPEASIFECISKLSIAVRQSLTKYLSGLLDLIFSCPLSEPLVKALSDLAEHIPPLLPIIQERLLNRIYIILNGQPYRLHRTIAKGNGAGSSRDPHTIAKATDVKDPDMVVLALNTLRTFNFAGHILTGFVHDCVVNYLDDDNSNAREAAALTCCILFANDPVCAQTSRNAIKTVEYVLDKLLTVAISDPEKSIRLTVLSSLNERFDRHLGQADKVQWLMLVLNDESFNAREMVITIIGRLTKQNPAYVMPGVRKALVELLMDLETSVVSRNKEESARLVGLLTVACQNYIKPYVEAILKVVVPRARDTFPGVVSAVFGVLSELAKINGEELIPYLDDLIPIIIETLQDQSSSTKRDAALKLFGQLASNTGFVIEPYKKYPVLLDILLNIIKTEQSSSIKRETMRVLGVLGAIDPYQQKLNVTENVKNNLTDSKSTTNNELALTDEGPAAQDDYNPQVAISALMKILNDPSLTNHYHDVIEATMSMFKTLALRCVEFLPVIIPNFLNIMRTCTASVLDYYIQQLGILIQIVKQHIRNYLKDILDLAGNYWNSNYTIQITVIGLVEAIASVIKDSDFKKYLPSLVPNLVQVIENDTSKSRIPTQRALRALIVFGPNLEGYMHSVVPTIVQLIERPDATIEVRKHAIHTIGELCKSANLADYASRIIHPLARVMEIPSIEIRGSAMETLCELMFQLGSYYLVYIPLIAKVTKKCHISNLRYEMLTERLIAGEALPQELKGAPDPSEDSAAPYTTTEFMKPPVSQIHLKRTWDTSNRSTKEDWNDWIRRLSVELLIESPSHALRSCAALARLYPPLANELLNAAFFSCWMELDNDYKADLTRSIEFALASPNISLPTVQILLNLAEFMEHYESPLSIDISKLGSYAQKCHAYAKALRYKENEFRNNTSQDIIGSLITINNNLQQSDSATGILIYAHQYHALEVIERWHEKLQRWEAALDSYRIRQIESPESFDITLGIMRCLDALGDWVSLAQLTQEKWTHANNDARKKIAPFAAGAAWGLRDWERMNDYSRFMTSDTVDHSFYRAIVAVQQQQYDVASKMIDKTRDLLVTDFMAVIGESYDRAYSIAVRVQTLSELEEIIVYRQSTDKPERHTAIRKMWIKRLFGNQRMVEVWSRILKVRALVSLPKDDVDVLIKFASMCRKNGRLVMAERTFEDLRNIGSDDPEAIGPPPKVAYAYFKHLWATSVDSRTSTLGDLQEFTARMTQDLGIDLEEINLNFPIEFKEGIEQYTSLLARCYLKQGEWHILLDDNWNQNPETTAYIVRSHFLATQFDSNWYKAWHTWATVNHEVIKSYETRNSQIADHVISAYVVSSVKGFFKAIALSRINTLQETLRLLSLLFKYGHHQEVNAAISLGIPTINLDTWLQVIPQLIARIYHSNADIRRLIHHLLIEIGKAHPQAVIYSLMVASKTQIANRKQAALEITDTLRMRSPILVQQALLVSEELIRVAISWREQWLEGLEEAIRAYLGDQNKPLMLEILDDLHRQLERGAETAQETAFVQAFGRILEEAQQYCRKYKETQQEKYITKAWDIYYRVHHEIGQGLLSLVKSELSEVSPLLADVKDLELAIPGSYQSGQPVIKIGHFDSNVYNYSTKQRPRRITIHGNDGIPYEFLLKAREDIRLDERVMQVFGLVNTLLAADSDTFQRHLHIIRYAVIPLSHNSGLMGFVPNCQTMHEVVRDYRKSKNIPLTNEHQLILKMTSSYNELTRFQKIEVFEYALANSNGMDLHQSLWLRSKNSEAWLDRRTNYTRSLAVMSMVGYILGLGDRHPSNLLMDKSTANVVHIDYGDCFEVAMKREKFPETVPFRLTRMMVYAMEVSRIEGNFRATCEHVMRVLRENKESLMAVLEAFVYDPLISWRLLTPEKRNAADTVNENGDVKGVNGVVNGKDMLSPRPDNMRASRTRRQSSAMLASDDNFFSISKRTYASIRTEILIPDSTNGGETYTDQQPPETDKALAVINRVSSKLTGRDIKPNLTLDVPTQVDRLIAQATSVENLCQLYFGWCACW